MTAVNWWVTVLGILSLLLVVGILHFLKKSESILPFFARQGWTVNQAAVFLILLNLGTTVIVALVIGKSITGMKTIVLQYSLPIFQMLLFWIFFSRYVHQSLSVIGLSRKHFPSMVTVGLRWTFAIILSASVLLLLLPVNSTAVNFVTPERIDRSEFVGDHGALFLVFGQVLPLLWFVCLGGVLEEVGYRGLLFCAMRKHMSVKPAIIMSSLCFMLAHGNIYIVTFGLGCISAYLLERYHSVMPGMVLHGALNLTRASYISAVRFTDFDWQEVLVFLALLSLGGLIATVLLPFVIMRQWSGREHSL